MRFVHQLASVGVYGKAEDEEARVALDVRFLERLVHQWLGDRARFLGAFHQRFGVEHQRTRRRADLLEFERRVAAQLERRGAAEYFEHAVHKGAVCLCGGG